MWMKPNALNSAVVCCTSLLYLLSGAQWWRGSPELLTALQRELAQLTEDASMQVVQGATHDG